MSCMKEDLLAKIESCEIVCGVVGLGYVGLPLAVEKAKAGFKTIGFDVQSEKGRYGERRQRTTSATWWTAICERLVQRRNPVRPPRTSRIVAEADFIAICVPTPLDEHQQPDISYVEASTKAVAAHLRQGFDGGAGVHHLSGHDRGAHQAPSWKRGRALLCGKDFYLGFSPERVDPGNLVVQDEEHAQGGGRHRRGRHRSASRPCTRQCWRAA